MLTGKHSATSRCVFGTIQMVWVLKTFSNIPMHMLQMKLNED